MSKQLESNQTTSATVRVNKDLLEAYDAAIESRGENRSQAIRDHMKRVAGHSTNEIEPPDEPLLRDGWEAIKNAADADGFIPCSVAKSRVAQQTRLTKDDVKRCVFKPLDRRGYIIPTGHGQLEIIQ